MFFGEVALLRRQFNGHLVEKLANLFLVVALNFGEDAVDRLEHELYKAALAALIGVGWKLEKRQYHTFTRCVLPFLRLCVPVTIAPKITHHLLRSYAELFRVHFGELL